MLRMRRLTDDLPYLDEQDLREVLTPAVAVAALCDALASGEAPGTTPLRTAVGTRAGELLLMPAEVGGYAGVKVASVGDGSAGPDVPRVQGVYVLFDGGTLTPVALADAVALTALRTASVSALAVDLLAGPGAARLLVFGSGPQALEHVRSIGAVRALDEVVVVGRDPGREGRLVRRLREEGVAARAGSAGDVAGADVVACCTTSAEPLFDSGELRAEAVVVAVGSHHRDRREVDGRLVERATVVVESREVAFAEAGDVVLAVAEGVLPDVAVDGTLADLAVGGVPLEPGRPRLFKSVGQAWQDLVLVAAVHRRGVAAAGQPSPST